MIKSYEIKHIELSNGETLAYREAGHGSNVLLLIHGNMSSGLHYAPILERLPEGFKAYAVDLRGFGDSTYKTRINSLGDFAEDIHEFVTKLGLKGFTMAGWSTGGGICMQYTAEHPGYADKLVLIESVSYFGFPIYKKDEKGQMIFNAAYASREEMAQDPVQVAPAAAAMEMKNFDYMNMLWNMFIYSNTKPSAEDNQIYINESLKQRNLVDVDWALATFNMSHMHNGYTQGTKLIDKIDIPVLSFWGKKDMVILESMAVDTVKAIGENARLRILEDCSHSPLIDCPDLLVNEIIDFAKQV